MRVFRLGPIQPHPEREMSQPLIGDVHSSSIEEISARYSLPSLVAQAAHTAASMAYTAVDEGARWTNFLYLCIILVQGRPSGISEPELVARVELENILMNELFDYFPAPTARDRENKKWIFD